MKATSIFGGVQVFNILITILRTKLVAVLLGPTGMGVLALLTSTTSLVASLTGFGLSTSAVKNISKAFAANDESQFGTTVAVFRKLVWLTGLLGFILMLLLANPLSKLTFDSTAYTTAFIGISITLLITQLSAGQSVVLRGTRQLKSMAMSSMIGALLGLIVSIPFYYFLGQDGIVPAIILTSVTTLSTTWYFSRKINIPAVKVTYQKVISEGGEMLRMGFMISLSGLITLGASYVVRLYISNTGSVADVGLYNAGFAMISTYVGMVFAAMSTDYYPRLSAVAHDPVKSKQEINQQAEISLLIIAPIILLFLVYIDWGIVLLYSEEFRAITEMVRWGILGIFFKSVSWAIAFIMLAKGASKVYFWSEFLANIYITVLNIAGYSLYGLSGLGISYLVGYVLYLFQIYFISIKLYKYNFDKDILTILCLQLLIGVACFWVTQNFSQLYSYVIGTVLIAVSAAYSLFELNKRLNVVNVIKRYLGK